MGRRRSSGSSGPPVEGLSWERTGAGEPITREGLGALQAEIEELEGSRRRELAACLNAARELGDPSGRPRAIWPALMAR